MLCRPFFRFISKLKLKLLKLTSLKDIKEQIIKIKTEITEIDIAESKIQLISLQLNPREKEGTNRTQEREKEPTEPKREGEGTYWTQEREPSEAPLKQCITADKPPYQRVSSESRQAHSHRIPSFPIAIP